MQVNGFPIEHFYDPDGPAQVYQDRRWRLGTWIRGFHLRNTQNAPDPDALLLAIFGHLIEIARADGATYKYSCIIRHPDLLIPIYIPFRSFEQNTPQFIVNEFNKRQESAKSVRLLDGPLYVEIVSGPLAVSTSGAGRPLKRFHRNINQSSIIRVDNSHDNYCLFLALELTRLHHSTKTPTQARNINKLINDGSRLADYRRTALAKKLIADINRSGVGRINPRLKTYSVEEHLPIVERFYAQRYPDRVPRIVVFDEWASYKPVYKGQERRDYDLCIYAEESAQEGEFHFQGIRNISQFIGHSQKFCIDCERPYERARTHNAKCQAKCTNCCGMGPGFPCAEEEGFTPHDCPDCGKRFNSRACLMQHLAKKQVKDNEVSVCDTYKRCERCGLLYNARDKQNAHKCYHRRCQTCRGYHKITGPCHVQKPPPRVKRHSRIVIFDFECSQDTEYRGGGRLHKVNFVGAYLMCTKCVENERWQDETTGECTTCGPGQQRSYWWSAADGADGDVVCLDDKVDPLADFIDWLLHLPTNAKTYALSHYGGRYDMHFCLGELYRKGGIAPQLTKKGEKIYQILINISTRGLYFLEPVVSK